ncbi:MAG TPA: peptide deformylase [Candidatus Angelobacter sp.]|jgi:peptide deformylase|nr:peptide deformylase [Candidatus Angelobacter sp.]
MKNTLISLPNPHLRETSKKVGLIDDQVLELVQYMQDITLEWEAGREHEVGVALAAIQIDVPLRVIVVRNDFDNKEDTTFHAFINPTITKHEGELVEDYEGCLSVKDLYGRVPRYSKVRIKALDLHGKEVRFNAEGFLARVFQHEIDHTNGKVFIDHIRDQHAAFYNLDAEGNLQQMDYEQDIANNKTLWSD